MCKVCNINIEQSKKINKEIKKLAQKIKKKYNAEVYLYGSFAKKEFHEGSDIDLIIIGDFEGRMFDRIGKILELTDLPVEPLVYTRSEFQQMKKRPNFFINYVIKNAKRL